jgi:hypothetical protein
VVKTRNLLWGLLLLSLAAPVAAAQGVKGRVALAGVLVEGVEVRAYAHRSGSFGPLTGEAAVARTKSALDGTYSLDLAPGQYVVEAQKKRAGNTAGSVEDGDFYCLYSGSPVTVAEGQWTNVGLYLVEAAPEKRAKGDAAKISGTLTFKGEPVERAYLYAYASASGAFRGPADLLLPVAKGSFTARLPAGKYYLVARKRMRGGAYGPIEAGDLFNFYPRNPVTIGEGEEVTLHIPLAERLDQLEAGEGTYKGRRVRVLDASGKPLAGFYVMAYPDAGRVGTPAAISGATDGSGETYLRFPPTAPHLRARSTVGGPLAEGETYVDAEATPGDGDAPLILRAGSKP